MTTTVLIRSDGSPGREATRKALRDAGIGVREVNDWQDAADELGRCDAALLVSGEELDAEKFTKALRALDAARGNAAPLPPDAARSLSHELRTPLSAMAGWVHLIETGKLDEAGLKRAATKLRGNIDDQVRTIERYLVATRQEGRG
jgi:signal transduction histidine kinase